MVLSFLFFIASFLTGLAILELFQVSLLSPIRLIFGLVLGIIINSLAIFGASFIFGLSLATVLMVIFITLLLSLIFLLRSSNLAISFGKIEIRKNWFVLLALSILSLFIVLLFAKSIYVNSSGIVAGNRLVWTDWPVHLALISSFVHGENFPPENPLYSGQLISYPFFADYLSSILQTLGSSLKTSLILPGIILGLSALGILYYFGVLLTQKKQAALLGLFIGLFSGGLGFWYLIGDLVSSPNFWATLTFPPQEYTFYQQKNLWFFSFLYSELLPQRSFLFGLPMFFTSLALLIFGLSKHKKSYLVISGYIVAIMPFFHMHSFIGILLFCSIFIPLTLFLTFKTEGYDQAKKQFFNTIVYFALPIIGLGLLQLPFLLSVNANQTFGLNWGWMKGEENFFVFWFKNSGFFWPLWIFAVFKTKITPLAKNIAIASTVLFILPNIFRFAPWPYDNLKIMTFWYLIGSFFVAQSLIWFYQKNFLNKIIAAILFLSLVTSGIIEVARVFNTGKTKINLWGETDIELANTIISKTEPKSVILTAAVHDHPVTALAGRRIIIGYPGNAWSWGLAGWQEREADVHTLFRADPIYTDYLLKKYGVDYVLIGPRERAFEPALNESYFAQNFTFVTGGQDWRLYQVK